MIATFPGGTWSAVTAPEGGLNPPVTTDPEVDLNSVSCDAGGAACAATGSYVFWHGGDGRGVALTEIRSHGTWTAGNVPLAGLRPSASGPYSDIGAIACPAQSSCLAIGGYSTATESPAIAVSYNGTNWSTAPMPTAGLSPAVIGQGSVSLSDLTCRQAGFCVATGSYVDSAGDRHGAIEMLAGGTWHARTAPVAGLFPAAAYNWGAVPSAVTCVTARFCLAVGGYGAATPGSRPLADTFSASPSAAPGYLVATADGQVTGFRASSFPGPRFP